MAINFCALFNAKTIFVDKQQWYYLTHNWADEEVHTFPNGICMKVNVIAQLEFELTYFQFTVKYISHYTAETHLRITWGYNYLQILLQTNRP